MKTQTTKYQPVNCSRYDYVEIACLHGYALEVESKDGSRLTGSAITTKTIKNEGEYLVIRTNEGLTELRLDSLAWLKPLNPHASFKKINMTEDF